MNRLTSRYALLGAALAASLGVAHGGAAHAGSERPARATRVELPRQRPLPLRLDEVESLGLLTPFRDPLGPPTSALGTYRAGPWGGWQRRLWTSLGGEPASARDPSEDGWLARRVELPANFPHRHDGARSHFFARHAERTDPLLGPAEIAVADRWVPPWLQRLDPGYASELLASAGCGRGGTCSPGAPFPADAFTTLWSALAPAAYPVPEWRCRERKTRVCRFGGEQLSMPLVRCDGALADGALERLSVLARPKGVEAVEALPDEPDPAAPGGEWVPGVRLLDPRLVWVLARLVEDFPGKPLYIYSGYRPSEKKERSEGALGHGSLHGAGRALDIAIDGVPNEELLARCYRLPNTGCGYYPNSLFVHVDVRVRDGAAHHVWVDASAPGQPSVYLPEWPGVVERGRVVWRGEPAGAPHEP